MYKVSKTHGDVEDPSVDKISVFRRVRVSEDTRSHECYDFGSNGHGPFMDHTYIKFIYNLS